MAVTKAKSIQVPAALSNIAESCQIEADAIALDQFDRLISGVRISPELDEMRRPPSIGKRTMYAIAFDLDTQILQTLYPTPSYNNAYGDIRKRLIDVHGFTWQQGSVYFGGPAVNAVTCVMAAIDLRTTFPWFAPSVKDIRMLRIEEENDLMPAVAAT